MTESGPGIAPATSSQSHKALKIGVVLPSYGPQASRQSLLDTARAAEELRFDSVWVTDHLALPEQDAERYGRIFETLTTLGYLAASTAKVRLGVSALVLPQRNPVIVARQVANLDVLSEGRILLAVGVGWSAGEYANLGQSFHDRGKRMDEAIQVLRTLWSGGQSISFQGRYYQFDKLVFSPAPLQAGGPPLWVGGESRAAQRRAALLGDGWHPNAQGPAVLEEAVGHICHLRGSRPLTISVRLRCAFIPSHPPAEASVHLLGSSEEILEQVQSYRAAGMNYAVINFLAGSPAARLRQMRRFAEEILPHLQAELRP
jgi:probable F420-dependent oxidoreductase